MTNIVGLVLLSRFLISETNSVGAVTPGGNGVMTNITITTSEVFAFTNAGKVHFLTNPIDTNIFHLEIKRVEPEIPPVPNQPTKL